MTRSGDSPDYELTLGEVARIAEATGPAIREGFKRDLDVQSERIETKIDASIKNHEGVDNSRFDRIDRRLFNGDQRMARIEKNQDFNKRLLAWLVVVTPIALEVIKLLLGK